VRPRALLAAAALVAVLGLAACGSGSSTGTGTGVGSLPATDTSTSPSTPSVVVETSTPGFNAEKIYQDDSPGVVTITSVFSGSAPSLFGSGPQAAVGAGFVTSTDGYIATNAHVVTDVELGGGTGPVKEAKQLYVQFADRNRVPGTVVGYDLNDDVALIKVDPSGLDLKPLDMATTETVRVGQPVAAIGSPFEQNESLSVGVVSAIDRTLDSFTPYKIEGGIQTDASINPGNSGGPLLDAAGRVVGINRQIQTTSGANQGVAFAIPITLVKRSIDQLKSDGKVTYAYIGVSSSSLYPQLAEKLNLPVDSGALVGGLVCDGPADKAGLQSSDSKVHFQGIDWKAGGDVIVAVDGNAIESPSDLAAEIATHDPGDVVPVEVVRDGKKQSIDVTLGERPAGAAHPDC
jgi:S1-C subfamily serine protease